MRIVVLGYIIRGPLGGLAWHHFQYVLGLKQMGFDVLFLEDSDSFPGCYHPDTSEVDENPQYGLHFIQTLFSAFNINSQWSYFDAHTGTWYGQSRQKVLEFCASADLVLNISGVNPLREWWARIPCRAYIDTDPGFTQVKHLTDPSAHQLALGHTCYFSFAENINQPNCTIPGDGFQWLTTRQPVCLDAWKISPPIRSSPWTTVMQWDSYQSREFDGQVFGMKSMSFEPFTHLPQLLTDERFEIALGSATAPVERLQENKWQIINSLIPTKTPWTYQQYIQQSKGEWSIAKQGYVASNSGWFSERSAAYLASGRPVIVQDTGFSRVLETGKGLLSFRTPLEAVAAIREVSRQYEKHCQYAREVAETYFAAPQVLSRLISQIH
jgi:hypothetical protein